MRQNNYLSSADLKPKHNRRRFQFRWQSGQALLESVASLVIILPIIIGGAFLVVFCVAYMYFAQKVQLAAQMGAMAAATQLGAQCFFLGSEVADPVATLAADSAQIKTTVEAILQSLGVPGSPAILPTITTVGAGASAIQFATISIAPFSFQFPGTPAGYPPISFGGVTASSPITSPSQTPAALVTMTEFGTADSCGGSGGGVAQNFFLPAFASLPALSKTTVSLSGHVSAHVNNAVCMHFGPDRFGSCFCGSGGPPPGFTAYNVLNAATDF